MQRQQGWQMVSRKGGGIKKYWVCYVGINVENAKKIRVLVRMWFHLLLTTYAYQT